MTAPSDPATGRFPGPVENSLREVGWQPGRWNIKQAEYWADTLREHASPAGHRHSVFPAAVEIWAEFGALRITPPGVGRDVAPVTVHIDPLHGLHMARTLADLGRALGRDTAPVGEETHSRALLAVDTEGRIYGVDHTGDWYLGHDIDHALTALLTGSRPERLTSG